MDSKHQLNVAVNPTWRSRLESIAAEETLRTKLRVSVTDLVRRALSQAYRLDEGPAVVTHVDLQSYEAAIESARRSGAVCIPSDDTQAGAFGSICLLEGQETHHRWFRFGADISGETVFHADPDLWLRTLDGALRSGHRVLPAERPLDGRLGYTVVETRTTHTTGLRESAATRRMADRIEDARRLIAECARTALGTSTPSE